MVHTDINKHDKKLFIRLGAVLRLDTCNTTPDQSDLGKNIRLTNIPKKPEDITIHPLVNFEYIPRNTGYMKPAATKSAIKNMYKTLNSLDAMIIAGISNKNVIVLEVVNT